MTLIIIQALVKISAVNTYIRYITISSDSGTESKTAFIFTLHKNATLWKFPMESLTSDYII